MSTSVTRQYAQRPTRLLRLGDVKGRGGARSGSPIGPAVRFGW
jgi:hypothetical protein